MKFNPLLRKSALLHVPVTVLEVWRSGRVSGQVSIELPVTLVVQGLVRGADDFLPALKGTIGKSIPLQAWTGP